MNSSAASRTEKAAAAPRKLFTKSGRPRSWPTAMHPAARATKSVADMTSARALDAVVLAVDSWAARASAFHELTSVLGPGDTVRPGVGGCGAASLVKI